MNGLKGRTVACLFGEGAAAVKEKAKKVLIYEAAAEVFAEKGFYAATVEEIANRAGVGKGTVYEYFPSKEALFKGMLKGIMRLYLVSLRERMGKAASAGECLIRLAKAHAAFAAEHDDLACLLDGGGGGVPAPWIRDWMWRMRERFLEVITRLIRRGIDRGEFVPVDPRLAAEVFLGALASICFPALCRGEREGAAGPGGPGGDRRQPGRAASDLEAKVQEGLDLLFRGLLERPDRPPGH